MKKLIIVLVAIGFLQSCTVLKEYEKVYLNDADMELSDRKCDKNLATAHSYREGASGGNGGKTGGGCGCN